MNIITRAQWDARPPKNVVTVAPARRQYFVVHHSGAPADQTVRAIQDWCMDGRGFADIDYNFLVRGTTGEIYEGRGWDVQGAHTIGFNTAGVGICLIGFDQASDAAKRAVRWLYDQYNERCGKTLAVRGHRDLDPPRDCPGDHVEAWAMAGLIAPKEETVSLTAGDVDVILARDNVANPYTDVDTNPKITIATALSAAARADRNTREMRAELDALREDVAAIRAAVAPPPAAA